MARYPERARIGGYSSAAMYFPLPGHELLIPQFRHEGKLDLATQLLVAIAMLLGANDALLLLNAGDRERVWAPRGGDENCAPSVTSNA